MTKDLPVWRSMLFVPVTQRRFVQRAARRGADAIILHLQDTGPPSEQHRPRTLVPEPAQIVSIARAHPRLVALNLGAEDFATSAGILPEAEALTMPKQTAVFAARAAGIMPMGFIGSIAEFHDLDAFRETIRRSRRFGFVGASVIHPSQIAILNEEFRPTAGEIDHAGRVVAAYETALAEGVGAV